MGNAIEFERVSKAYRLGEQSRGFREALMNSAKRALSPRSASESELLWALRDVSFEVKQGESVGFVGPNGAGKTTILKILSRITKATSGTVRLRGRTSSLIELGAGFHPDLTGRENIYLNGTILGMSRREVRERFDEIIEFSGLEGFLDTPVKRYSSGMYARLAFSVAAHTNADILLVDEVLAVGDVGFQAKSAQRMTDLVAQGATVLFISHSLYYVASFCHRAVLLNRGRIQQTGEPREIIAGYQELMRQRADAEREREEARHGKLHNADHPQLTEAALLNGDGEASERFTTGEPMTLRIRGYAPHPVRDAVLRFSIFSSAGVRCVSAHSAQDGAHLPELDGEFEIEVEFPEMLLMPDSYSVTVWLMEASGIGAYDWHESWKTFLVGHPTHDCAEGGVVYMPRKWAYRAAAGEEPNAPAHRIA